MTLGITSDHRGYDLKQKLTIFLKKNGYNIIDYGTDSTEPTDYPIFAKRLGMGILNKEVELGIAICSTGIGMSIALNKIKGIRCAKVANVDEAVMARLHNNANTIALAASIEYEEILAIINTFINTKFSNEPRHTNRLNQITNMEELW